jgi:hypothetical protein
MCCGWRLYYMAQTSSSSPDKRARSIENEPIEAITITCTICDAVYAPSPMYQSIMQMSATTLEKVFTSICHFCFRCRRLACPECWDTLHSVCGACAQEVNLPFRAETAPLDGAIFSPSRRADTSCAHPSTSTLVCIHRGRFHIDAALAPKSPPAASKLSAKLPQQLVATGSPPTNQPGKGAHAAVYYIPIVPLDAQKPTREEEPAQPSERFMKAVERTMTAIASTILLVILVLIILAAFSSTANLQIIRLFHIDIRGEIAYLTYLIQQLHW